jgi:vacuolar-type H+-ATPase subunit I/STV1
LTTLVDVFDNPVFINSASKTWSKFSSSIEYKLTEEENFDQVFDAEFIKTYESNIKKIKDKKEELEQKKKDKTLKSFNETLKTELKEATEENFDLIFDEQN